MYKSFIKRMLDLLVSLSLIIVLAPVILLVALLLKCVLGAVLFRQERPGLNERIFTLYKFKTMSDERDENGNLLPDEFRLKPFGKAIRSLSLDELPQAPPRCASGHYGLGAGKWAQRHFVGEKI